MKRKINRRCPMEKVLEQILEKLNSLDNKVSNMETDIKLIKTQQSEDREILQAVRNAQEVHTAKLDNIEIELAKQSGEQKESFQALANMYGEHQFEITKLKQVK
jgi:predicted  nucleic acid-binding Zn-ribbon protein